MKLKKKCSYGKFWINTLLSTFVQLLYYILKCNYFWMTIVSFFVKIIYIPDEELFSETYFGCTASLFVLLYDVPVGFVSPLFWDSVLLYLRSSKDGCCSISDDLPCSDEKKVELGIGTGKSCQSRKYINKACLLRQSINKQSNREK